MTVAGAIIRRVVPPPTLLRWLCRLDNQVYRALSRASVWYGDGLHPKHRLTRYHDFFVARVAEGERVLDVGCGLGALAADLARQRRAIVTAVDHDPDAIRAARQLYAGLGVTFVVGDARDLPEAPFDVVILSNVLEHLDGRPGFLRTIARRTAARGVLVRVPLFERDWRVPLKRELGVDFRLDPTHCTEYTLAQFESEVAEAGLVVAERDIRWGEIWAACRPHG